jgi:hypothetical protein
MGYNGTRSEVNPKYLKEMTGCFPAWKPVHKAFITSCGGGLRNTNGIPKQLI